MGASFTLFPFSVIQSKLQFVEFKFFCNTTLMGVENGGWAWGRTQTAPLAGSILSNRNLYLF